MLGFEWMSVQEVVDYFQRRWPVIVDLFASAVSQLLPVYFSAVNDSVPGDRCDDASLGQLSSLHFLPFTLIRQVLNKLHLSSGAEMTTFWYQKECYLDLLSRPCDRPFCGPSTKEGSTCTISLPSVSSESPYASASYLEIILHFACHLGFIIGVACQLAYFMRKCFWWIYQHQRSAYHRGCAMKGHLVSRPSLQKVANFLLYLRRDWKMFVPCNKGYRSMLCFIFNPQAAGAYFTLAYGAGVFSNTVNHSKSVKNDFTVK